MKIQAIIKTLINNNINVNVDSDYSLEPISFTPAEYKNVYSTIGEKYCWWMKQLWTYEQLQNHINSDSILTFWIKHKDQIIGFCELQNMNSSYYYLQYFGLFDNFIGKGHGKKSLDIILNFCKNEDKHIFTTTNNLDHENALKVYEGCGFKLYTTHEEVWDIPINDVKIILTERNKKWLLT